MSNFKKWAAARASIAGLCVIFALSTPPAAQAQDSPRYQLDGNWPKPLPVNWTIMGVTGMFVDKYDNIWVLNRPRDLDKTMNFATLIPPTAECCVPPPAVLEFNAEGDLLRSWGGPDPQQKYLYVADMMNSVVWIFNRNDGTVAGRIGHAGHLPGQFHSLHVATADSHGNIYTGEVTTGERIQKFVPVK